MDPMFHYRIDLTKAGIAASIFGTACTIGSDANKKRAARTGSLVSSPPGQTVRPVVHVKLPIEPRGGA
jgi:hypothetical protein